MDETVEAEGLIAMILHVLISKAVVGNVTRVAYAE
jgi:hypothetical protein